MNKITFPLKRRMKRPEVGNLQDALQLLLDRGVLLASDEAARRELSQALQRERVEQTYGGATAKLVGRFQEERGLQASGEVDEPTANALNALLKELGAFDREPELRIHIVSGAVRREDGLPLQGLRVRAAHGAERQSVRLGQDITDDEGRYTIRYESLPGVDAIHLRVSVIGEDGKTLQMSQVIANAKPLETVDLTVPVVAAPAGQQRIEGTIVLEHGLPAEKQKLRLYRRDFGGKATVLNETATLAGGRYAFAYDPGGPAASLEVRAVKGDGQEILLSKPLNDLSAESRVSLNLVAPGNLQPLAAEYRRLAADLTPHVGQMTKLAAAKENAEQQDITVLNRATGWDARLVALAATTERLVADEDVTLPQESLYGLLRAGLPSDKLLLAQVEPDVAEQALKKVRDAGIVELNDQQIGDFKRQFATFATKVRLNIPAPGSRSTYGALLKASGLPEDTQTRFASVYLGHDGDAPQLWDKARQAGLGDAQIGKLQLQGKFAFLAGNSEPMTTRLMAKGLQDPVELVGQSFHNAAAWKNEAFESASIPPDRRANLTAEDRTKLDAAIPAVYAGEMIEARLDAYAEDMARKVRLSYPTQVLGRLMETDDKFKLATHHDSTATLLRNATSSGFRLGETPASTFLKSNAGVQGGLTNAEFQSAGRQLKVLQRVYQITPTNDAMPVLMSLGMDSAFDVMAYTEERFVSLFEAKYLELFKKPAPPGVPQLVRRKATQVSSVTYNLFTIAKKLDSEPLVAGLSAPVAVREIVRNELIKHYPTMESLFGSMDFCECEHCRSVLSPAAYLVDLLQFVDTEPAVWENFLAYWKATHGDQDYPHKDTTGKAMKPYDVLVERRPDLPHIALTCENTHTAMPHIDIVNEILEYYVAHGKLAGEAAHDTDDATSEELLAEPQNVIRDAYEKLREASYPITLPFDLWLETARHFCDHFETPLKRVLEVFRTGDDLFAPAQTFDYAAIFMESLGLSPAEVAIFTNPNSLASWHKLYGFATPAEATTEATDATTGQRIDLNSAKALSRRLGVTYREITDIVQTGFVNPELGKLALLYKLGVTIRDARFYKVHKPFYEQHKDLIGAVRDDLQPADQQRFDNLATKVSGTTLTGWAIVNELASLDERIESLGTQFVMSPSEVQELRTQIQNFPFDKVLVLADPDAGCNFDLATLQYADGTKADPIAFLRINLFVRLWRKLGWTIEETDRALQAFVPKTAPFETAHLNKQPLKTALIYLAHLKALDEKVRVGKQSRIKLITLWSDLTTTGKKPLYAQLFLTRTVLKSDAVFDDALGQYLSPLGVAAMADSRTHEVRREKVAPADKIDPTVFAGEPKIRLSYDELTEVQYLSYQGVLNDIDKAALSALSPSPALGPLLDAVEAKAQEFTLIRGHLLALQGALGLTADEISHILEDAGKSLDTAELSLPHVSLLYRYGLLAKALKLTVLELIALKHLSGLDPFKLLHSGPLATLDQDHPFSQTLEFVKIVEEVKSSGLKIEDLEYLLRHRFDETGKYRPDNNATRALLKTLAVGVRAIRTEHAVPDDLAALSDEVLRQKLGLALPSDIVGHFLAMMDGTAEFTATKSSVASANQLKSEGFIDEPAVHEVRYNATRQEQKLTFRGVLFDAEKVALKTRLPKPAPLNPHVPSPILGDLLDDVQQQARAFFEKHLQKQAPNVQPASGFLDAADFDLLFDRNLALAAGETEQDRVHNRRMKLANAFLPFLQTQMIRQFIVQTMTAQTGADPVLVESLITDERLLAGPKPLQEAFTATSELGLTATFFNGAGAELGTKLFADADTSLKGKDGNPLKPAGANGARFEGYLEVPTPGAYRFYVALGKQNAEAELRFDHLPDPVFLKGVAAADNAVLGDQPNQFLELKPRIPYRFSLDLKKLNGGEARLLVQGETMPKESVSQLTLYPLTAIQGAERAGLLLTKALQLVQSLGLNEREIRYLLTHAANFGGVNLSQLPTQSVGDTPAEKIATTERFTRFLRLAGYARVKRDLAGGTDDLIGIFEANETTDVNKLDKKVYPLVAKLTRRDEATVKATANALVAVPADRVFESEIPLQRLWEALQVVERFGVPVASLLEWTRIVRPAATPEERFEIARDLKEAIKARFEPETWQRVAQPIFNKLRQRQRDALVSLVMHQHGFDRMEQTYEYFLIDPGMEPVVQTSRIRLAISSLQLFIQRSLLNLELKVHPSTINSKHWEWMKRFRVWEANRKIFLFPENWLEPEFRDDKSHLFNELEGALLQGDVSSDLVEDAFVNYLKKLDELARLDIVAMHIEDNPDPTRRILHVFGRTYSLPHKYFYRRYAHQMWTRWEPVSVEIEGDHLAPVVWRDRLYLFWVTFLQKPVQPVGDALIDPTKKFTIPAVKINVEAQLNWSEYLQGEWTTRESGGFDAPSPVIARGLTEFDPKSVFIHVSKEYEDGEERGVYIHLNQSSRSAGPPTLSVEGKFGAVAGNLGLILDAGNQQFVTVARPFRQAFYLAGRNSAPESKTYENKPGNPFNSANAEMANRYSGNGPLKVSFRERITPKPGATPPPANPSILQQGGGYMLLPCNNITALGVSEDAWRDAADSGAVKAAIESSLGELATLIRPVFYQDNRHTFFVEPDVTERTIEEWQDWVTSTPQPEPGWTKPDWWKDIVVIPEIPWNLQIPDPGDPWRFPIDRGSLINSRLERDWLLNPASVVKFGDVLIGPTGQPGIEILTVVDAADGLGSVRVNPGSDVAGESKVVLRDENAFARSGLTAIGGGLNIVGGAGFNSALEKNFTELNRSGFGAVAPGAAGTIR